MWMIYLLNVVTARNSTLPLQYYVNLFCRIRYEKGFEFHTFYFLFWSNLILNSKLVFMSRTVRETFFSFIVVSTVTVIFSNGVIETIFVNFLFRLTFCNIIIIDSWIVQITSSNYVWKLKKSTNHQNENLFEMLGHFEKR